VVVAISVAVFAGACFHRPTGPETRATYFVEKMVKEPQAIEDLRAVAEFSGARGVDSFLDSLPTKTAVGYLRSRVRFGSDLKFHATRTGTPSPDRRLITVSVSEGMAIGATPAIQLQVELRLRDNEWKVTALSAL